MFIYKGHSYKCVCIPKKLRGGHAGSSPAQVNFQTGGDGSFMGWFLLKQPVVGGHGRELHS